VSSRRVAAVVLAGGRSRRFGRDKLAEPLDGRALLAHAIEAVRPLATEILVVVAPGAILSVADGNDDDVTVIEDTIAFEGPLAGILAGLDAAREPVVLVVGGDMPTLVGAVIESMLLALDAFGVEAVVLEHEGRARPLPLVLRRDPALAQAERLFSGGERRLRALPDALATRAIPEATWRAIDPDARTIRDIDTPEDLERR
jgi:molybdopterin-guanine dinucleotide biosynthesis protein A